MKSTSIHSQFVNFMEAQIVITILSLVGAAGGGLSAACAVLFKHYKSSVDERLRNGEKRHEECEDDRRAPPAEELPDERGDHAVERERRRGRREQRDDQDGHPEGHRTG